MSKNESIEDRKLLSAVLDELIPPQPEYQLAGAGREEVVQYVDDKLTQAGVAPMISGGLAQLTANAQAQFGKPFAQLEGKERVALLQAFEQQQPMFLQMLMMHTCFGYYQQTDVLEQLGYDPRPPFPKGYDLDVGDEELFRNLKQRVGGPEEAQP
jgi:hypothetical protein